MSVSVGRVPDRAGSATAEEEGPGGPGLGTERPTSPPVPSRAEGESFVTDWTLCDWPTCETDRRTRVDAA